MTTCLEDILAVCSQIMDYLLNLSERQILMLALAISIFVLPMVSLIIIARYSKTSLSYRQLELILIIGIAVISIIAAAVLTTVEFMIVVVIGMVLWMVIPSLITLIISFAGDDTM